MIALLYCHIAIVIYHGYYMPMVQRIHNRIEIFNEVCIMYSSIAMLFFTDWVPSPETQLFYGWSMIALLIFNFTINLSFVFFYGFKSIYLVLKRYKVLYCNGKVKKGVKDNQSVGSAKDESEAATNTEVASLRR